MNIDITGNLHGPTVFFLAGWPDTCDVFRHNLMAALAPDHRIVGLTLPGYDDDAPFLHSYRVHHDKAVAAASTRSTSPTMATTARAASGSNNNNKRTTTTTAHGSRLLHTGATGHNMCDLVTLLGMAVNVAMTSYNYAPRAVLAGGGCATTTCAHACQDALAVSSAQPCHVHNTPATTTATHAKRSSSSLLRHDLPPHQVPPHYPRPVLVAHGWGCVLAYELLLYRPTLFARLVVIGVGGVAPQATWPLSRHLSQRPAQQQHELLQQQQQMVQRHALASRFAVRRGGVDDHRRRRNSSSNNSRRRQQHGSDTVVAPRGTRERCRVAAASLCRRVGSVLALCRRHDRRRGGDDASTTSNAPHTTRRTTATPVCGVGVAWWVQLLVVLYHVVVMLCYAVLPVCVARVVLRVLTRYGSGRPDYTHDLNVQHDAATAAAHAKQFAREAAAAAHACSSISSCCCCRSGGGRCVGSHCAYTCTSSSYGHHSQDSTYDCCCQTQQQQHHGHTHMCACCSRGGGGMSGAVMCRAHTYGTVTSSSSSTTHAHAHAHASCCRLSGWRIVLVPFVRTTTAAAAECGGGGGVVVRGYTLAKSTSPRPSPWHASRALYECDVDDDHRYYDGGVAVTTTTTTAAASSDDDDDAVVDDVPSLVYAMSYKAARRQHAQSSDDDSDKDSDDDDDMRRHHRHHTDAEATGALRYVTRVVHYRAFFFPSPQRRHGGASYSNNNNNSSNSNTSSGYATSTRTAMARGSVAAAKMVHAQPHMAWLHARYYLSQLIAMALLLLLPSSSSSSPQPRDDDDNDAHTTLADTSPSLRQRAQPFASRRFALPVAVPLLFVYGDRVDACVLSSCTAAWCDYVGRVKRARDGLSDVVVVRGGGHWCFAEPRFRAAVAQRVRDFVTAPTSAHT